MYWNKYHILFCYTEYLQIQLKQVDKKQTYESDKYNFLLNWTIFLELLPVRPVLK